MSRSKTPLKPYDGREPFLFVSYARSDWLLVEPFLQALADKGARLWWDAALEPGEHFSPRLEQRIDECAGFLVFLSPRSVKLKKQN